MEGADVATEETSKTDADTDEATKAISELSVKKDEETTEEEKA